MCMCMYTYIRIILRVYACVYPYMYSHLSTCASTYIHVHCNAQTHHAYLEKKENIRDRDVCTKRCLKAECIARSNMNETKSLP